MNYTSVMPEYNPDGSLLRRLQMRMLDILVKVDEICRRHNLKYWLCAGTLLGAVRHGGFIPWDDDVDIEMPREDFKKLIRLLPKELPDNLVLQTSQTDPGYYPVFAKVRERSSQISEENGIDRFFKYKGIYIDIFPIEKSNNLFRFISQKSMGLIYNIMRNPSYSDRVCKRKTRRIRGVICNFMMPIFRGLSYVLPRSSGYGLGIAPYFAKRREGDIYPLQEINFEGYRFLCPHNPDNVLKSEFGDYMQLPPEDMRRPGHAEDIVWDLNSTEA